MKSTHRLSRADFGAFRMPEARRIHGAYFWMHIAPLLTARKPKFSCVVSKKVSSKAVDRNLIKRRSRAIAMKMVQRAPIAAYALHAKRGAADATFADLERDIASLFARLT